MTLLKKMSVSIIPIAIFAAMAAFAAVGVAQAHNPEECDHIPAERAYDYAVCHHQSDQAGAPAAPTNLRFSGSGATPGSEASDRDADYTWERRYASDPITTCVGVRIAAASMAYAAVDDEIVDGPLVEEADRNRDCVTVQWGWIHRIWIWFD